MTNLSLAEPDFAEPDLAALAPALRVNCWECSAHEPGTITHPDQLATEGIVWWRVGAPCTAAQALAAAGRWNFDQPVDIDAFDWCFRARFAAERATAEDSAAVLHFEGLAGVAEVWLNGQPILTADNMFRSFRPDVTGLVRAENQLVCIFRSLKQQLAGRRPRPRWKTNLVQQQQLRWHRTSLLGRIPGWAPCAPAVGPWREVRLETAPIQIEALALRTEIEHDLGVVHVRGKLRSRAPLEGVEVQIGEETARLPLFLVDDRWEFAGEIRVLEPALWWPHTHGEPALYDCTLSAETAEGRSPLGEYQIGFRTFAVDRSSGFAVSVNGVPIFCRGACWTTADLVSRQGTGESLAQDLRLAREAGMNMLRIGGTMAYETDAFYRLCDELGILVWQDFMFANMDYPVDDPAFRENIRAEAVEQITRLAQHPSVAIYCGNSEIEQQAAMLGMPRERWSNAWFDAELPELCASLHPGTHYVSATPTGGVLPFQTNAGVTHYYGVGAYLRDASDVRRADVKFTSECLGFANVPDAATCFEAMNGLAPVAHHPRWKARVPRDTGAGWDFEDVRDHYLAQFFHVDPVRLRSVDMRRYWQLSRVVSGEMMTAAFSEWRSAHSSNSGALVWFFKDLWPGAGWGLIDSHGSPKAAYFALKRLGNPRQLTLTDEGLNGLDIHLTNETAESVAGTVEVTLLREPQTVIARQEIPCVIGPRSRERIQANEILGRFYDISYAYRFGPPQHEVVIVTWYDEARRVLSEAFHFIERQIKPDSAPADICAEFVEIGADEFEVTMSSDRFLHHAVLQAEGYLPDDNYFHLPPQRQKHVRFRPLKRHPPAFAAELEAVNLAAPIPIVARRETEPS
ncbi:MAG TPA: hypothetical protein VFE24_05690 [Pirellulales bacterium]|nr:hypothetical protein [Pirellulales bacterium]